MTVRMPSQYSKQMSASGMQEIDPPTSKELDDANLARMGKRPVLKVGSPRERALRSELTATAQLWIDVYAWFQLYNFDYVGRYCRVSDHDP